MNFYDAREGLSRDSGSSVYPKNQGGILSPAPEQPLFKVVGLAVQMCLNYTHS